VKRPATTKAQRRILACYRVFAKEGISPTLSELARKLSRSKTTTYSHVTDLAEKGLLQKEPAGSSWRYTLVRACPTCGAILKGDETLKSSRAAAPAPEVAF